MLQTMNEKPHLMTLNTLTDKYITNSDFIHNAGDTSSLHVKG